ncbi:MAG: acyl-CoA dehydrogenase family protein, partial [Dehalococcoidia bacterium]|nr:acyl-CoA dehydrogenase family protein [Dehalococcoidia bacterium]
MVKQRPEADPMPSPLLNYADIALTPEQAQAQQTIRSFVDEAVLPIIADCYEQARFPCEIIPDLAKLGVFGPTLPIDGDPVDPTTAGLICQELERGDSGLRSFVSVQSSLVMYPIWQYGSDEHKRRYLPGLHQGRLIGCFGLTEHDHGSDPASMQTRATRDGDRWVLNGVKMWITNAPIADVALIWAKVAEDGKDVVRGFLVETDAPGFRVNPVKHKLSLRVSMTGEIVLEDCRVPADAILPGARGMRGPLSCLNEARFGISFGVLGAAMACYETALAYSLAREQWGRPIAG